MSVRDELGAPVRRFGTSALAGVALGGLAVVALTLTGGLREATETTFAVGTLVLGVGVLGWSGSVMAGRGMENLQRHLDTSTDWTEMDSRRAMTRVTGVGAGLMVVSALATGFL